MSFERGFMKALKCVITDVAIHYPSKVLCKDCLDAVWKTTGDNL